MPALRRVWSVLHTNWSLPQHTSATTYACAIGNASSFKTVTFSLRRSSRELSRLTCRVGRRVGRRVDEWTVRLFSRLSSRAYDRALVRVDVFLILLEKPSRRNLMFAGVTWVMSDGWLCGPFNTRGEGMVFLPNQMFFLLIKNITFSLSDQK